MRSIYRKGDRGLFELPFGYCDVIVEGSEIEGDWLRFYGMRVRLGAPFTVKGLHLA